MENGKKNPEGADSVADDIQGTEGMGYWDFRKKVCTARGWLLRMIAPQTYEVIDKEQVKIGLFKSGEGFFPDRAPIADGEKPSGTT